MSPSDLEDFSSWIRTEHEGKRYRKRTVKRCSAWIEEERTTHGFRWWIVEDVTETVIAQSMEEQDFPLVHVFGRSAMTPAQIQAMLDPIIETMFRIIQVRRTGEVPQVKP